MKHIKAPAVVRKWKRFIACGCNHGELEDPLAISAILKFKDDFNPDKTIHLGDFSDCTAFRSGAAGGKDEGANIDADISNGLTFLEQLRPDVVFIGNHEDRIWALQDSIKAKDSKLARDCVKHVTRFITKELKAKFIDTYSIDTSWACLGPFKLGHGFMFNEAAIRDHADMVGNCIIAHLHRAGVERGRVLGGSTGICVGMLADPQKLTYANRNRAKNKWTQSWVYGEYCQDAMVHHHYILRASQAQEFYNI